DGADPPRREVELQRVLPLAHRQDLPRRSVGAGRHPRASDVGGGTIGFATGSNNRRQVGRWTGTTMQDPTCVTPQVLQFRPVIWRPGKDQIEVLPQCPTTRWEPPPPSTTAVRWSASRGSATGPSGSSAPFTHSSGK